MSGPNTGARAEHAGKVLRAIELRARGRTWEQIATEVGYRSRGAAATAVRRELDKRIKDVDLAAEQHRAIELEKLDAQERAAWGVLEREHVHISAGKIVRLGEPDIDEQGQAFIAEGRGEPVKDDAPVLQAIDRLLKIGERRARLLGLDQPVLVQGDLVHHIVEGVDLGALT